MNNLSSGQVLEKLDNNLNYLYWHCTNDDDTSVIQDSIEQVSYLEKIINELIDETIELNKTIDKTLERDIEFINGLNNLG